MIEMSIVASFTWHVREVFCVTHTRTRVRALIRDVYVLGQARATTAPWRHTRCDSIFTAVMDGQSRYGLISKFVQRTRVWESSGAYACVCWFCKPRYPNARTLIVRIDNRFIFDESLSSIISLEDIDPSRILVEIGGDRDNDMYVMRIEGWDTIKRD